MEQETSQSETDVNNDHELVKRRAILAAEFHALPAYGSAEFWSLIEGSQSKVWVGTPCPSTQRRNCKACRVLEVFPDAIQSKMSVLALSDSCNLFARCDEVIRRRLTCGAYA